MFSLGTCSTEPASGLEWNHLDTNEVTLLSVCNLLLAEIAQRNGDVATFGSTESFSGERVTRLCTAPNNRTGFLCDDRVTCVPASWVCDRVSNCRNGEDEQEQLCGDLPQSLPGYLVFYCSSPRSWVYADQRCNGMNDCGDCSDETWSWAACPPCGQEWWSCSPVHFEFCSCIPRRLCRDGIQHCRGWSDEFLCPA
ncbi:low-density lipoprotein receptor class A domain-containing protein 1 isoform X4 [Haemorhous mexicanus]|uniref:low-density lipoprotein receptor class A domain-containing protein 1 isoform X4 n=1 Tax=Haemorhous mexicanus TaxID=30427 RepID=UPI0028BD5E5F|nr:low-density lipoprotein receptor class A domain-containing protein 1 isoform X4 [Haemorhous mexicanus]